MLGPLADVLPPELRVPDASAAQRAWDAWVVRHDRTIRGRLQRGDEETIVNWLLFGTTFTKLPRVALDASGAPADEPRLRTLIAARTVDLANALAVPAQDERRIFTRSLLEGQGHAVTSAADRGRLVTHLTGLVESVLAERSRIASELQATGRTGAVSDQFAVRSKLFRDRGVSLDTSFRPSFALEQALRELRQRELLKPDSIRDVAVIGPGLDFTDKASGYDLYPQQTLQPFTVIDSLVRVGLVNSPDALRLTTLDISPRVNDHLDRARRRAAAGEAYQFSLPLERDVKWKAPVLAYWNVAGDRVGRVAGPVSADVAGARVDVRTISTRAAVVQRIEPQDLNIVVQRSDRHRFDLVVATNVFVYYDVMEQVLALANVRAMLKPGGFLLSNNALLELPSSRMRSVGYVTVEYSDIRDDGDHIVWYRAE